MNLCLSLCKIFVTQVEIRQKATLVFSYYLLDELFWFRYLNFAKHSILNVFVLRKEALYSTLLHD